MNRERFTGPVSIPQNGAPETPEKRNAFEALDLAAAAMEENPGDPDKQRLFQEARKRLQEMMSTTSA